MADALRVLVRRRQRSEGLCQGQGGGEAERAAGQSQPTICARPPSDAGDRSRINGRWRACLAWPGREIKLSKRSPYIRLDQTLCRIDVPTQPSTSSWAKAFLLLLSS